MNCKITLLVAACVVSAAGLAPAKAPAKAAPAAKPAAQPAVVATVGAAKITRQRVDGPLRNAPPGVPPQRMVMARQKVLNDLILAELMHAYVIANKVPCDPKELTTLKGKLAAAAAEKKMSAAQLMAMAGLTEERLKDQVRLKKLAADTTSKKSVAAFVKAHPSYFNGTKVQASHILIKCAPVAPTAEQKAAVAKLKLIGADIQAGKSTFPDAARKHSVCPSGESKGGDLGEFAFAAMVPPFAAKAFDMKVGQISGVVRTQFGFHVIKVTKRTEGKGAPGTDAAKVAGNVLMSRLQNRIFDQALTTCPIVVTK